MPFFPQAARKALYLTASMLWLLAPQAQAASHHRLHGHRSAAMMAAPLLGSEEAGKRYHLSIGLPWRNATELAVLLEKITDPSSPQFRQYLSPTEFALRFGPSASDYQALSDHMAAMGMQVLAAHSNRLILDVEGDSAAVERAFHVRLKRYRRPDGSGFFGPDDEPSLDLDVPVSYVQGLDDFVPPKPRLKFSPLAEATPHIGSGPSGLLMGNDFRNAYAPGVSLNGAGQSVALFELDTYYAGDLQLYRNQTGLGTPVQNVYLDGWDSSHTPGSGNGEVTLDIEMAMAMAPGQDQVVVYMGPNINDVLNRIATDNRCKQISSSWGWGPANATELQIEQQYAAQGQSYFNASGDSGAFASDPGGNEDDPMQILVGGTNLSLNGTGGSYASESGWSGSTGGVLTSEALPSYQQGISMASNHGSTSFRNAPDVGAAASGILLYADNGHLVNVGGTSCAAPLWAGFTALVNQQAVAAGKSTVGFMNPALYAIGKGANFNNDFHDVMSGNNGSPNFPAVAGYDLVTGWGSPKGQALINDLSGFAAAPTATPTPVISATWRVNAGGPALTDSAGHAWSADTNFSGGATNGNGNAIAGTPDQALYQSERWGSPSFSYAFHVPQGPYQVTLKFAEIFDGAAGQRLMNISINGTQVLANFDVFADAGGMNKADDKVFNNIAPNGSGQIVILVSSAAGSPDANAKINAIQIVAQPATATPTSTATPSKTSTPTWTATATPTWTFTPSATVTATATRVVLSSWRINAGGPALTDSQGQAWAADVNFSGGATNGNSNAIAGTADQALYQSERWGNPGFSYALAVPPGSYQLTLKFAEIFDGASGQRLMNVFVNGSQVLANFDVFADAGGMNKADDKVFGNISPDGSGQIVVQLASAAGSPDANAKLSAIQLVPQPATATPTWTASRTATSTPTWTWSSTPTWTGTATAVTGSATATPQTPAGTATPTWTGTATSTASWTPSATSTATWTASSTSSSTWTATPTWTSTATKTLTPIPPTSTATWTASWTATKTSTPTPTKTWTPLPPTPTRTFTAQPASAVSLNYRNPDLGDLSGSPHPQFGLQNMSGAAIQLTEYEIRYWLSCDCNGAAMQSWLDWSSIPGTLVDLVPISRGTQTHYLRIRFSQGYGLLPTAIAEVQTRFNKADWSNVSQFNDYSFGSVGAYIPWSKATVYHNGVLVWGTEPGPSGAISLDRVMPKEGTAALTLPGGKILIAGPNPASDVAHTRFSLGQAGKVKLLLATFSDTVVSRDLGELDAGIHDEAISLAGLANGLYFAHLLVDHGAGYHEEALFKLAKQARR